MGRLKVDVAVRKVTTRVNPSGPLCNWMIRANGHLEGGYLSSVTRTKAPSLIA